MVCTEWHLHSRVSACELQRATQGRPYRIPVRALYQTLCTRTETCTFTHKMGMSLGRTVLPWQLRRRCPGSPLHPQGTMHFHLHTHERDTHSHQHGEKKQQAFHAGQGARLAGVRQHLTAQAPCPQQQPVLERRNASCGGLCGAHASCCRSCCRARACCARATARQLEPGCCQTRPTASHTATSHQLALVARAALGYVHPCKSQAPLHQVGIVICTCYFIAYNVIPIARFNAPANDAGNGRVSTARLPTKSYSALLQCTARSPMYRYALRAGKPSPRPATSCLLSHRSRLLRPRCA